MAGVVIATLFRHVFSRTVQYGAPSKQPGKLLQAGFLILIIGAFHTNFSITMTPEFLILP